MELAVEWQNGKDGGEDVSEFWLMVRISSSSCSVRDNRQWYNNSGNYQGSNQYAHRKQSGEYSVENIIIYVAG